MPVEQQQITNTESNDTSGAKALRGCCTAILATALSGAVLQGTACALGYLAWCTKVSSVEDGAAYAFAAGAAIGWLSLPLMAFMIAGAKELYKKADQSYTERCLPFLFALTLYLAAMPLNWLLTASAGMAMIKQQELIDTVGIPAGFFGGVASLFILTAGCCCFEVKCNAKFFYSPNRSTEDRSLIANGATAPHDGSAPVSYQAMGYQ